MKLCFISYARNNNLDKRLTRFVDKLRQQLPQHLPHNVDLDDLTFFDVMNIQSGEEWMNRLAGEARECKVCLCFYSPPYFTSQYSGREVQVFLLRLKQWQQDAANVGKKAAVIQPIIWVPAKPPSALAGFQHSDSAGLPDEYLRQGLLSLALRKGSSNQYNAVLDEMARRIAATATSVQLPVGPPIASFDSIPSAFEEEQRLTRYGIAVLVLAESAQVAQPFAANPNTSLDELIGEAAEICSSPARPVPLSGDVAKAVAAAIEARQMLLLVAHKTSIESPLNAALIQKIVASLDQTATVLIFSDPVPDVASAELALRALMGAQLQDIQAKAGEAACLTATDSQAFTGALSKRFAKLKQEMMLADPAARVSDEGLSASAASQGIATAAKPALAGPGG